MSNRRRELLKELQKAERTLSRVQEQLDRAKDEYRVAFEAFTDESCRTVNVTIQGKESV